MNNKWIVPIVAILLCAVSLIGAGYAALSATLVDNETTTIDNDYLKLTLDHTVTADQVFDLEWKQEINYAEAAFTDVTYTVQETADQVIKFQIDKAASFPTGSSESGYNLDGVHKDTVRYELTVSGVFLKHGDTDVTDLTANGGKIMLAIYDAAGTTDVYEYIDATSGKYVFEKLQYDTAYIMKAKYVPSDPALSKEYVKGSGGVTNENDAFTQFANYVPDTLGFTLTAEAIILTSENSAVITFDANGGTGTQMADQFIKKDTSEALSANTYVNDTKTFLGWATSADATEAAYVDGANYTAAAAGNVTLYAVWGTPSP